MSVRGYMRRKFKRGGERREGEDPHVTAQRIVNVYRQLHVLNEAGVARYKKDIVHLSAEVKMMVRELPGGREVFEFINYLTERAVAGGMDVPEAEREQVPPPAVVGGGSVMAAALARAQAEQTPDARWDAASLPQFGESDADEGPPPGISEEISSEEEKAPPPEELGRPIVAPEVSLHMNADVPPEPAPEPEAAPAPEPEKSRGAAVQERPRAEEVVEKRPEVSAESAPSGARKAEGGIAGQPAGAGVGSLTRELLQEDEASEPEGEPVPAEKLLTAQAEDTEDAAATEADAVEIASAPPEAEDAGTEDESGQFPETKEAEDEDEDEDVEYIYIDEEELENSELEDVEIEYEYVDEEDLAPEELEGVEYEYVDEEEDDDEETP